MKSFDDTTIKENRENGIEYGSYPPPSIVANHVDGPLLYFTDGQLHWLTLWERLLFHFGLTDAEKLQRKLRPRLTNELQQ